MAAVTLTIAAANIASKMPWNPGSLAREFDFFLLNQQSSDLKRYTKSDFAVMVGSGWGLRA
jgi:hypothetical protein